MMMMTLMDTYMYVDGESEDEGSDGDDGNGNDSGATSGDGHDSENGGDGHDSEDGGDGQDGDNGADGDVAIPEYLGHPRCPRDMANKDPMDCTMLEAVVE